MNKVKIGIKSFQFLYFRSLFIFLKNQIILLYSSAVEITISEADKINDSAKDHTIYKNTANMGNHKGEVRYFSILKDNDNQRYVMISTADYNLTCMMVDTFKFY